MGMAVVGAREVGLRLFEEQIGDFANLIGSAGGDRGLVGG